MVDVSVSPDAPCVGSQMPYVLVALNGARKTQADHPRLPVTTGQIVDAASACHIAGAQGVHLHIRDHAGRHTLESGQYRETIAALKRQVPEMQVQITTEAGGVFGVSDQFACLRDVRPEWASISVREVARADDMADRIYGLCADQGTRVQHILYDAADAAVLSAWRAAGIVRAEQSECLLVLGRYADRLQSVPDDLNRFPEQSGRWMVCAFGAQEHGCLLTAARRGADIRVGFENSTTDSDGVAWSDNAASVAALVSVLKGQ